MSKGFSASHQRRGFSLIEVLVVVTIIGVLIALLLPAVQAARESSRRASCASKLNQIALASLAFESVRGELPPGYAPPPTPSTGGRGNAQVLILPFLELSNIYNSLNLSVDLNGVNNNPSSDPNTTACMQGIDVFLCPSDGSVVKIRGQIGRNNYFANLGDTASQRLGPATRADGSLTNNETDEQRLGVFNVRIDDSRIVTSHVTSASIRDGMSNTAMFSETRRSRLPPLGPYENYGPPLSYDISNVYLIHSGNTSWNNNVWPAACSQMTWRLVAFRGLQFYRNIPETCNYSHTIVPNFKGHDCGTNSFVTAHIAARSYHPGGVNVALCDGSVRFVKDSVSLNTWRALGTRARGEVVSQDSY